MCLSFKRQQQRNTRVLKNFVCSSNTQLCKEKSEPPLVFNEKAKFEFIPSMRITCAEAPLSEFILRA